MGAGTAFQYLEEAAVKTLISHWTLALSLFAALGLNACGGGGDTLVGASETSAQTAFPDETANEKSAGPPPDSTSTTEQAPQAGNFLAEAGTGTIKWNPGHYVTFASDTTDDEIDARLEEIRSLPFKGIVVRAFWKQLEPRKDVYNFRRIDRHLSLAAAEGKRFFLLLSTRNFRSGVVAPDYLRAPLFDGGVYQFRSFKDTVGENITLWDDNVRNRLALLIKALARRYDGHPYFEGIILSETSFGQPISDVSDEKRAAYYSNLLRIDTATRAAFSRTVVIQFINFPHQRTGALVNNMLRQGIGFGAPDVFLADEDHEKYVYPYNDMVQGRIPIGMQIESDSYIHRCVGCAFDPAPVKDLYIFARDRLHSNYVFWEYVQKPWYDAWTKVKALVRSPEFPGDPAGGLVTACPRRYAACVSDGR